LIIFIQFNKQNISCYTMNRINYKPITDILSFHFSETEFVTDIKPECNNFYFDAVIQIEWDCAEEDVNTTMCNDTTIQTIGDVNCMKRNMSWLHKIRQISKDKLNWCCDDCIYMSIHKVMDGVINCYVTRDNKFVPDNCFDMIIENTGFLKIRYMSPYTEMYVTMCGICEYNDTIQYDMENK
jgi:hypothetical protein